MPKGRVIKIPRSANIAEAKSVKRPILSHKKSYPGSIKANNPKG